MPAFGSEISRRFMQERFRQYLDGEEAGTLGVLVAMARQPGLLIRELVTPPIGTFRLLVTLVLPLAFLPWLALDAWILVALPLFIALSSRGGNAMAVSLRFMLYLVPGIFGGVIFWWSKHQILFESKGLKRFWKICLAIAFGFTLAGNPHRSLSAVIPDSIEPWVHITPKEAWRRGLATQNLLNSIPKYTSIAAETQLVPQLAQRRILLRFPEHYEYLNTNGTVQKVDLIISQPRYNAAYAPAFQREKEWVQKSTNRLESLAKEKDYGILECSQEAIVLEKGRLSTSEDKKCLANELEFARKSLSK